MQEIVPSPWSTVRLDAFTHHYAFEYVKKNQPNVLYIAYGETDDFAHDGEFHQYLHSANRTDKFIEELWNYVQSTEKYKDKTTFIISTDHGRGVSGESWKDHGTKTKDSEQTWFAVIGPDTPAKGEIKTPGQFYNNQYAATLAWLLGVNDFKSDGSKIAEIISK
jgi:membrane-anchored protein YejM (alkaline phosphatase superfamily)